MKKNIGTTDRIVRIVLALVFIALYFTGNITGLIGIALMILSVVFVATGFMSFCPLYAIFGLNSCPAKKTSEN